jgi:hypothetical protein
MYKSKADLERVISLGKNQNVIEVFAESYLQGLEYDKWVQGTKDEHEGLYPTKIANPDYVVDGEEPELIDNPDFISYDEYMDETRVVQEAVEATYDDTGLADIEAVAEVTELVRPYVAKDVTDRVDAYIRQAALPSVVTMRQARLALLQGGLLTAVETTIVGGTDEAMKIEWEYATEINRDWDSLVALTTALGMTSAELDDLFQLASTL